MCFAVYVFTLYTSLFHKYTFWTKCALLLDITPLLKINKKKNAFWIHTCEIYEVLGYQKKFTYWMWNGSWLNITQLLQNKPNINSCDLTFMGVHGMFFWCRKGFTRWLFITNHSTPQKTPPLTNLCPVYNVTAALQNKTISMATINLALDKQVILGNRFLIALCNFNLPTYHCHVNHFNNKKSVSN